MTFPMPYILSRRSLITKAVVNIERGVNVPPGVFSSVAYCSGWSALDGNAPLGSISDPAFTLGGERVLAIVYGVISTGNRGLVVVSENPMPLSSVLRGGSIFMEFTNAVRLTSLGHPALRVSGSPNWAWEFNAKSGTYEVEDATP